MSKMSLSEKQIKFANMLARLILYAERASIPVKIVEFYRTPERQAELVKKGLSKTLDSKHLKGLAVDLAIIRGKQYITNPKGYEALGRFWEAMGGIWGGSWKSQDAVHFEYNEQKTD